MSNKTCMPRILAEYGNTVIIDYNNCFTEEPYHSALLKTHKKYVIDCANLCDGVLVGHTETTLSYQFFDSLKESIFKNSFVRA